MALTHDVLLVTADNYPSVFAAFELISHDGGRQAGHVNYPIPIEYVGLIGSIEDQLRQLLEMADSDFACLCTGEAAETARIVQDYRLDAADKLLQEFFNEFS